MADPYSVRIMSGRGANRKETYTVPAGKRLVVLHVAFVNWASAAASARCDVHGIPVLYRELTAAGQFVMTPCRFTAYAGETVVSYLYGTDMAYAVDGWLLYDADGTPDDADNVIDPIAAMQPLPVPP